MQNMVTKVELPDEVNEAIKSAVLNTLEEVKIADRSSDFPLYMNKKQTAKYLGVAPNTFSNWVVSNEIPYKQIGGTYRFNRNELDKFMATK